MPLKLRKVNGKMQWVEAKTPSGKTYYTKGEISRMSYNVLGKRVSSGQISERRLRSYYKEARKEAMKRGKKLESSSEFGPLEKPFFMQEKNLVTTSALLHEIADINRFLKPERSTIQGLKADRSKKLETLHKHGFNFVSENNFSDWTRFMNWFYSSEFARYYDSSDPDVEEVFNMSERGTPAEWTHLFNSFLESGVDNEGDSGREY